MPKKGSKRKKTRTHVKPQDSSIDPNALKVPKSFVVKSGTVGTSVAILTRDVRKVLEPNTGSRIRERKANRLRDFVSMSGPLGVTHLLVFSQPPASSAALILAPAPPPPAPIASTSNSNKKKKSNSNSSTLEEQAEKSLIEGTTTLNLRLIRLPRGPTLSFKVLRYSLASDVQRMARRPRGVGREFAEGPMLILSGFGGEDKQLKLMTTVFQNLFPAIHVQTMPLSSARRVVLLSYNSVTRTIDFRHYLISVRPIGVSRPIRKIIIGSTSNKIQPLANSRKRERSMSVGSSEDEDYNENNGGNGRNKSGVGARGKGIVDLSRAEDISDFILRQEGLGFQTSDSEMSDMSDNGGGSQSGHSSGSEEDERRGKVRLAQDYVGRGNRGKGIKGEKRAVRLVELGPRMELGLIKVEEGVGEGEVMFHEIVHKSVTEAAKLAKVHAAKRKLAAERRAAQAVNVAAKKAAKKALRGEKEVGFEDDEDKEEGAEDEEDEEDENAIDSDNSFDYDESHGILQGEEGSEEEFSDGESEFDEDEGENNQAIESDADDSDEEEDQEEEENYSNEEEEDSDTSPVPLDYFEKDEPSPYKKVKQTNKPSSSAMSFKHKGFTKQERAAPKGAAGIFLGRPEKKDSSKDNKEDFDERGGGGRGGRGGSRGGSRGSDSRGGRGGDRGRSSSRGGSRGGFEKRGGSSRGGSSRGGSSGGRGGRGGGRGRGK